MQHNPVWKPRSFGKFIERLTGLNLLFRTNPITHPLLRQDVKDIHWLQPDPRARVHRMIVRRVRWAVILTLVLLLIDLGATLRMIENAPKNGYASLDVPSAYIFFGAILVSLGLMIVGDFWYLFRGLRAISPHRESGHWDMIRLTPTPAKTLLGAKYIAVQLQSWRVLSVELLPRLYLLFACVPFLCLTNLQFSIAFRSYLYRGFRLFDLENLLIYFVILCGCICLVIESVWRMRAVTALGLVLSARSRNTINGLLIGFFIMIGIHVLQISVVLVMHFGTQAVYREWYRFNWYGSLAGTMLMLIITIVGTAGVNYIILRLVRLFALHYALRYAFRDV